jgi:hypothetical protein
VAVANARPGPHPVFHFVTGISARFATHGYCTGPGSPFPHLWGNPRFVGMLFDSLTSQNDVRGSMHPNGLGQIAIGDALFGAERYLADPLSLRINAAAEPVEGTSVPLAIRVSTTAGTPVPGATILIDGAVAGTTDQTGRLTLAWTFATSGGHTIGVDQDPYPATSRTLNVMSKQYTVSADPSPVPVGRPVALTLRATDAVGRPIPGMFTLAGRGTAQIASGATATVTLTMRYASE